MPWSVRSVYRRVWVESSVTKGSDTFSKTFDSEYLFKTMWGFGETIGIPELTDLNWHKPPISFQISSISFHYILANTIEYWVSATTNAQYSICWIIYTAGSGPRWTVNHSLPWCLTGRFEVSTLMHLQQEHTVRVEFLLCRNIAQDTCGLHKCSIILSQHPPTKPCR